VTLSAGDLPYDEHAPTDESFLEWATSEEIRKRSLEIYEEMRVAETVWEIRNGKVVRVANPLTETANADDNSGL
jgi:hypothetical protein